MRHENEVFFVRRRNVVVRRAMMMMVACLLLLSTPFPSVGGSDDPLIIDVMDTTRPNAVAGPDITVAPEEGVYLNASLSTDDVGIVSYNWSILCDHGPPPSLWYGMVVGVAFHHEGIFNITLTVWDAAGNSDEDHMIATVGDFEPPVAVIGEDLVIDQHTTLDLNGTASTDNWMIVAWNWTITSPDDDTTLNNTREISHTFEEAGVHTVTLRVTDPAGLWNEATINVTVLDTTDPLAMLGVNTTIDMGETFHLNGTSSWDNVGVVNWTWSVEGPGVNDTYYGPEANHTFHDAGVYTVILNVTDAAGNRASNGIMVTVRDTELPVANAGNDVTVDEGTLVVLDANASTDNVGIDTYVWSFLYGGRMRWIPSPSPTYSFTFDIPGIYTITLNVTDAMGHVGTDQLIITVLDITPPVANAGDSMVVDQHTTVNFSSPMSSDNVAIVDITWTFEYDGEERVLTGTGSEFTFDLPGVYTVTLVVSDAAGNTASDTLNITVEDITPPSLVEDLSDDVATTGDVFHARVRVKDNVGIVSVFSVAPWASTDVEANGNGLYEYDMSIPSNYTGRFYIQITVIDLAGNEAVFDLASREVVDDDAPIIEHWSKVSPHPSGRPLKMSWHVQDNIGVDSFVMVYMFGDGEETRMVLDPSSTSIELETPRHPGGPLRYSLAAQDVEGNVATTDDFYVILGNFGPEVYKLPSWEITEGTDAEFDLSPYVTDPNDKVLVVTCDDTSVTVSGMVLHLRQDVAVPDYTVTLTVSDGEVEAEAGLTIHVVNVNDPPVMTNLLPANGTKIKEGKKVVLSVNTSDEEGDDITVTWWNGDVELGNGSPLEVKLEPGEHIITVVIDDGSDQVEDTITIVVKKAEESPGFGPIVAMAAVLLAFVDVRRRRR